MNSFCKRIANFAIKSMLYEVATSPKPGLVDRYNPGAHDDMDFFTFMDSIAVLPDYFYGCAWTALNFEGQDYRELMEAIRPLGIEAEKDMFEATANVNTHKGMIFSLGILSAAGASIYREENQPYIKRRDLSYRVRQMTQGICDELENYKDLERELTYGEKLYRDYGIKGIRGEVESGFETVLEVSLPIFDDLTGKNLDRNTIFLHSLISLMAYTEDSNILGRHDIETLKYVRDLAKEGLNKGGALSQEGLAYIEELDRHFIEKNISSGGAADLLSVTIMYYLLEKGEIK